MTVADNLLQKFCLSFENLYGEDRVIPNMHLHCHLKECMFDFGPIYSFWLFSFERRNGILGSLHNSNKDIECHIMLRFCRGNAGLNLTVPQEFSEIFDNFLKTLEHVNSQ